MRLILFERTIYNVFRDTFWLYYKYRRSQRVHVMVFNDKYSVTGLEKIK